MVKTEFTIHSDYLSGPGKIYFTHQDVILAYIEPEETVNLRTSSDLEDTLQKKIEAMYQERCTQEGYVVRNHKRLSSASQDMCKIRIVSRDPAYAAGEHFNGSWVYKVFFKYLVCNPSPQSILPAVVVRINKIGMMCQLWPYEEHDDHIVTYQGEKYLKKKILPLGRVNYVVILLPFQMQLNVDDKSDYENVKKRFEDANCPGLPLIKVRILQRKFEVTPPGTSLTQTKGRQINAIGLLETNSRAGDSDSQDSDSQDSGAGDSDSGNSDSEDNNSQDSDAEDSDAEDSTADVLGGGGDDSDALCSDDGECSSYDDVDGSSDGEESEDQDKDSKQENEVGEDDDIEKDDDQENSQDLHSGKRINMMNVSVNGEDIVVEDIDDIDDVTDEDEDYINDDDDDDDEDIGEVGDEEDE